LDKKITDGAAGGPIDNLDLIGTPLAKYHCPSDGERVESESFEAYSSYNPAIPELAVSNYVASGSSCDLCLYGYLQRGEKKFSCPNGMTGVLYRNSKTKAGDILDGTSKAFIAGERGYEPRWGVISAASWPGPPGSVSNSSACWSARMIAATKNIYGSTDRDRMINGQAFGFHSQHPGGVHVATADGSQRFIAESISQITATQLVEIADGAVLEAF
jgi:hypothetical protein